MIGAEVETGVVVETDAGTEAGTGVETDLINLVP